MNTKESIDWASLPFGYLKTDYNVRASFIDGKWSEIEVSDSEMGNIHMASTCLHYGQEIFEGMKAFKGVDGVVRIFRPEENLMLGVWVSGKTSAFQADVVGSIAIGRSG